MVWATQQNTFSLPKLTPDGIIVRLRMRSGRSPVGMNTFAVALLCCLRGSEIRYALLARSVYRQ